MGNILLRAAGFAAPVVIFLAITGYLGARQFEESLSKDALLANQMLLEYMRLGWVRNGAFVFLGAAGAFAFLRARLPGILAATATGLVFAMTSYFVPDALSRLTLFKFSGQYVHALWWTIGAALFAYAGAMMTPAVGESTKGEGAGNVGRFVAGAFLCALGALFLAPILWGLWLRQFHPFMFLLAAPYAGTGGLLFGLLVAAIPDSTITRIQSGSWLHRVVFPMAPGILASVAGCILAGTFMRWQTWGSTASFISATLQFGLQINDQVLLLCVVIGMICSPIIWRFYAIVRAMNA